MWHWKKKSDRGKKKTLALYIILYDYISKGCTQYVWYTHTQHFLAVFLPYFFGCHWGKLGGSDCAKNVHIGKYIGLIAATPEEHSIRRGELWRIASFFFFVVVLLDVFFPLSNRKIGENGPCVTTTPGDAPSPFFLLRRRRRRLSVSRPPAGPLSDRQIDFPIEHSETFAFFSLFFYQPKNRKYRGGRRRRKKKYI